MNQSIFGPRIPPWYAVPVYAACLGGCAYGITHGSVVQEFVTFSTTGLALFSFAAMYYDAVGKLLERERTPEPQPELKQFYADDTQTINGKVWLQMPGREVPLYITRPQHLTLAAYIRRGELRILHEMTSKARAFKRGELDELRKYCLAHDLATKRGREVWLVEEAANAIVAASARPHGTIRAGLTIPGNPQQLQLQSGD